MCNIKPHVSVEIFALHILEVSNIQTEAGGFILGGLKAVSDKASESASELFTGASSIYEQTRRGWQRKTDDIEIPAWMKGILGGEEQASSGNGGGQGPGKEPQQASAGAGAALGAATVGAFGYGGQEEEDERSDERVAKDDQMMLLTKKMIQIRTLLLTIGQSDNLTLPSIVVIGSQSSGKSSVLEAIVGHEFLPKGSNMVTRRPVELTLVNTPNAKAEYGEFPATMPGHKITDFDAIRRTLTDLNLAVSDEECVTDDPIQLRIYGPNIPDLSLIDLPGYIQVTNSDQPPELKRKIEQLCERYIQPPNVILAISAADVDLANSTALRASRKVDPRGERTLGVITKMDLVEPERGAQILNDKKYGLRLGYIGVVCKLPPTSQSSSLFTRSSSNVSQAIIKNERAYFSSYPRVFGERSGLQVGVPTLRRQLMTVLEATMASSLKTTSEAIHTELAEATYEFKVQYNDRPLSAETYLAESLDAFKHAFRGFSESFGRQQLRELLKHELDQKVLDILAQRYWNKPIENLAAVEAELDDLKSLPRADPDNHIWRHKLDTSSAALTKLGIGRLATTVVATALQSNVSHLIESSIFAAHPSTRASILAASEGILRDLSYDTSDELEICLKPYKYRIELEDSEWSRGRENAQNLLKEELKVVEAAIKATEATIGGRKKARDVMAFIDRVKSGQVVLENDGIGGAGGFSAALLAKGKCPRLLFFSPVSPLWAPLRPPVTGTEKIPELNEKGIQDLR